MDTLASGMISSTYAPPDHGFVSVVFDDGVIVGLEDALAYGTENPVAWPKTALRRDGFASFAKGWRDTETGAMVRIGAGAYGDTTLVLERVR